MKKNQVRVSVANRGKSLRILMLGYERHRYVDTENMIAARMHSRSNI